MISILTPNPARDVTYRVPQLVAGASHRLDLVGERAGGKGTNSAGVLACMGRAHRCVAVVGQADRDWWVSDLRRRGIQGETITAPPPHRVRLSTTILDDDGGATVLNEQGSAAPVDTWRELRARMSSGGRAGDVVAVCGSLPGGAPVDELVGLVRQARQAGMHVLVDGSGPWLEAALEAHPSVVKVNADEAQECTGCQQPEEAARRLLAMGAGAALVTAGADGVVLAVDQDGPLLRARLPKPLSGNPTGAGDAMGAALCVGLEGEEHPPLRLADWRTAVAAAVAWSGAAVLQPLAGEVDPRHVETLLAAVVIEEMR